MRRTCIPCTTACRPEPAARACEHVAAHVAAVTTRTRKAASRPERTRCGSVRSSQRRGARSADTARGPDLPATGGVGRSRRPRRRYSPSQHPKAFPFGGHAKTPRTRRPLCVSSIEGHREVSCSSTGQQGRTTGKAFHSAVTSSVSPSALILACRGVIAVISVRRIGDNLLTSKALARDSHEEDSDGCLLVGRAVAGRRGAEPGLEPLLPSRWSSRVRRGGTGVVGSSVSLLVLPGGARRGCPGSGHRSALPARVL